MKMGELFVKERQIVVPGDVLATGMDYLPAGGAYRDKEDVRSNVLGVLGINGRVLRVIPLKSHYRPRPGDMVIAKVSEMTNSVWFAELDGFRDGVLSLREVPEYVGDGDDLSQYYNFGDHILAKVINVGRTNVGLTLKGPGLRKLHGGRLIHINAAKVPRVIGKQGSMIGIIKDKTGCRMIVGQNGLVWIQGPPQHELVAIEAIKLIDEKGHLQGLTEVIGEYIDKKMKNVKKQDSEEKPHEPEKASEKKSNEIEEKPQKKAVGNKNKKIVTRGKK
jgi:exosome complex component RRP4